MPVENQPTRPEPGALYEAEVSYVWSALHRLGVAEQDLADLAHDVFVAAVRRLPTYDPARPIRPWLFGICFRVAAASRRLARSRREPFIDEAQDALAAIDGQPRPDEAAATRQEQRMVLQALQELDLERRAVVVMHDLEGHTVPEIAEALDVGVNTTYSRLRLGREELVTAVRKRQGVSR